MHKQRFDDLTRALATGASRRRLLGGLAGGGLAGVLGLGVGRPAAAVGNFIGGRRCRYDSQCCSGKCREGVCAGPPNRKACRPPAPPPGGTCTPRCADVAEPCGPDGCGGSCGTCQGPEFCVAGECVAPV